MEDLTPMMRQYHQVKRAHAGKLLLFRLGDFYELFFEDAVQAAKELEITLTSRHKDRRGVPIPMCGVPYHSVDGYIARLLKKGYKVAICEQVEDPKTAKKIVQREVTRVITPGTVVEENLLESQKPNYLACLSATGAGWGLSFLDSSTGDFRATFLKGDSSHDQVDDILAQFQPRELIFPKAIAPLVQKLRAREEGGGWVETPLEDWVFSWEYGQRLLLSHFQTAVLDGLGLAEKPEAVSAAGAILHYLHDGFMKGLDHIRQLAVFSAEDSLRLDPATIEHLELLAPREGARKNTLYGVLNFTRTGMGARLLRDRLITPFLDLRSIQIRLDAVGELKAGYVLRKELGDTLGKVADLERLLSRITVGTCNARTLESLRESLRVLPALERLLPPLRTELFQGMRDRWDNMEELFQLLEKAIHEEPPATLNEGGMIRDGYDPELDELRRIRSSGKSFLAELEAGEKTKTGISSLKVRYNQVFGYYIEVTRANLHLVPSSYQRKQTLVNAERFITPELKEYEEKILSAEEKILTIEREIFQQVREKVIRQAGRIVEMARLLAELDVQVSLAEAAARYRYHRPGFNSQNEIYLKNSRHPVLDLCVDPFIANDVYLNDTTHQLIILTGPNMGGKSTYLRQVALNVILAHMGSFIPAEQGDICLTDQIFTRVGASDNISLGRSTFMVEMIETANILNRATPRSLILLDEVGRGTATFDGLSLAWSIAEYLHNEEVHRAKTVFATHYHEMTKLPRILSGARNFCMTVQESGGTILFLHKVAEGAASRSYGIEVARLAGIPQGVLRRAREILARLERRDIDLSATRKASAAEEVFETMQKSLF